MDALPTSLEPLPGGHSGETFLAGAAGEQVVLRVYAGRSVARGPRAPEVDAAVLALVRDLLPVPEVLEVRSAAPGGDRPGLLVTSLLPGERLERVLGTASPGARRRLGHGLGVVLGRLGHVVQPRAGLFAGPDLLVEPMPRALADLPAYVDAHAAALLEPLADRGVRRLRALAADVQSLLDEDRRTVLVHGDLNARNVLVDPGTHEVTGVLDWEFVHAGSPWTDLGNLLRFDRDPELVAGVLDGLARLLPRVPDDALDRARGADLFSLVDLAVRPERSSVADRATALLRRVVETGDVHATVPPG